MFRPVEAILRNLARGFGIFGAVVSVVGFIPFIAGLIALGDPATPTQSLIYALLLYIVICLLGGLFSWLADILEKRHMEREKNRD